MPRLVRPRALALRCVLLLCVPPALSACGWLSPYRVDIQQGNVVDSAQVAQLRVGLSREQVRFILGTPLVTDVFHANRWDYVHTLDRRRSGAVERGHLVVFFDAEGKLARWQADIAPSAAAPSGNRVIDLAPALPKAVEGAGKEGS